MAELCAGALAFTLVPAVWLEPFAQGVEGTASRAACATLAGRLTAFAGALQAVGRTVQQVCEKPPPRQEHYADLCARVADRCCHDCERNTDCWVTRSADTLRLLQQAGAAGELGTGRDRSGHPSPLSTYCLAPARLAAALNREAIASTPGGGSTAAAPPPGQRCASSTAPWPARWGIWPGRW